MTGEAAWHRDPHTGFKPQTQHSGLKGHPLQVTQGARFLGCKGGEELAEGTSVMSADLVRARVLTLILPVGPELVSEPLCASILADKTRATAPNLLGCREGDVRTSTRRTLAVPTVQIVRHRWMGRLKTLGRGLAHRRHVGHIREQGGGAPSAFQRHPSHFSAQTLGKQVDQKVSEYNGPGGTDCSNCTMWLRKANPPSAGKNPGEPDPPHPYPNNCRGPVSQTTELCFQ